MSGKIKRSMNKPMAAAVMQKLFLLIRRSVARATMRTAENANPETVIEEGDSPAYEFGCSSTAAGSISVDRGDEYPEL